MDRSLCSLAQRILGVSEYQYYEFRAMDRALTKAEMANLRSISTRAVITSTSFTNHYEWGDLKADPLKLLEKYFDAFVYVANWGTREFYLRIPQDLVDYHHLKAMLPGDAASVRRAGNHVIIGFEDDSERDDWDEGTGWMGSLMALRSDLLRGDHRCLYLGWLHCVQCKEIGEDELEPPVPAGMSELSAPLHAMIDFLGIDDDLIELAASASPELDVGPNPGKLTAWIRSLPEKDKDDLLATAALGPSERWRNELVRRFRHENAPRTSPVIDAAERRTVGDLLAAARVRADERARRLKVKQVAEAARQKAEAEAERTRYLDQLEKREAAIWDQITAHVQKRQPNEYDKAVLLLIDLRDLAIRRERLPAFQTALEKLRQANAAKQSFLGRLAKAKL